MFNKHLIDGAWRERYCDLLVDSQAASLCIMGMNAQATLIGENGGTHMWVVQHDITPPGPEPEQLAWCELPQPTDIIGEITSILDVDIINHYIFIQCNIHLPVKSDKDDQSSSEDIYERKAIIAWDIQDINRVIPLYIQQDNEVRDDTSLPELIDFYMDRALGFTQLASDNQSGDASRKYIVYDLKRESHYSLGSSYTTSHTYIQSATEDYAQVITLYFNSDDMIARDESPAVKDDEPTGLRVHWHSYIFDDEHSLEGQGGEIIMPYCDNPRIDGQRYGPGLMMVMIYDAENTSILSEGTKPFATLALVRVPDHSLPQNGISRCRRALRDGAIGEVIWTQPIATKHAQLLYSQNLIVVQRFFEFDILSGSDGKIVRQFDLGTLCMLMPVIGPYCYLLNFNYDSYIIDIETEMVFQHSTMLRSLEKRRTAANVEDAHDPSPTDRPKDLLYIQNGWPFCNCVGKLIIHEPRYRNRFYLYSLSSF
jgi:hypothetical protein